MYWCQTRWGLISHILNELEIICLPQDLPEFIEVDLENLELGNSIHISQISLPKGVNHYYLKKLVKILR